MKTGFMRLKDLPKFLILITNKHAFYAFNQETVIPRMKVNWDYKDELILSEVSGSHEPYSPSLSIIINNSFD